MNYALIILSTIFVSFASFFIKLSTGKKTLISIITSKLLYLGFLFYLTANLITIWILKEVDYSIVVPLGCFCFIWSMFLARFFLKEKIGIVKIIGILFILGGVVCIAIS
ncbi:MAG: EamA family transporter [Treponema sp.]|nr:EamA family transporter [Treponema sp.]